MLMLYCPDSITRWTTGLGLPSRGFETKGLLEVPRKETSSMLVIVDADRMFSEID